MSKPIEVAYLRDQLRYLNGRIGTINRLLESVDQALLSQDSIQTIDNDLFNYMEKAEELRIKLSTL